MNDINQNISQRPRHGWKTIAGAAVLSAVGSLGAAAQAVSSSAETAGQTPQQGPSATAAENEQARGGPVVAGQKRFDIAAGSLSDGLDAFQKTSGTQVHTRISTTDLQGFHTSGVKGTLTETEAMTRLLGNTGLSFHFDDKGQVVVEVRNSEQVEVNASVNSIGLQQFTEPVLDTAQTIQAVPQFILSDEQDTSLRDALRNVPGISLAAGEGGSQGDNLTIRGFTARNDIFLDGIRDFGSYYRDAFDFESVDVLEGPAGVEFGRGSTGGVVNQESKQPGMGEHIGGTLQLGSNLMRRVTADINEPIGNLPGAALRVNLVGEESGVAERDFANVRRFGVAPSVVFGLNGKTRYFVNYLHEGENDLPDYGLPYFGNGVPGVRRQNYYGFVENNYFRTNPDVVTGKVEHDFSPWLSVHNSLRWANYPRDVDITEPQITTTPTFNITGGVSGGRITSGSTVTATCSASFATPCYALNTPASSILVRRNQIAVNSVEDMLWDQALVTGHKSIGHIGNDFIVIVEGGRERSRPQRPNTLTYTVGTANYTPLLNPNTQDYSPSLGTQGVKTYVNSQSYGAGFNDTLKLTQWLQLSGGIRFDYFNTDYISAPTHLSRLDKQPTYRAAAVFKPRPNSSIYFDYGTSFNPSAESLSLSANNAIQPPQYNESYEAGAKYEFLHDRLNVDGSWFQTTKTNVSETDPNNSANVIQVGPQRVRGAQIGALGHLPQHFDLILGYAFLSGITVGSQANYSPYASVSAYVNGAATATTVNLYLPGDPVYGQAPYFIKAVGNPFANVPKNSANLFLTHSIGFRFIGGFGFNQVSARRASSTGPVLLPQTNAATGIPALPFAFKVIPGYVSFNAMIKRPISDRLTFQANVNNLTNAFFIDLPHPNHLIPGEGINAQFGFNYNLK